MLYLYNHIIIGFPSIEINCEIHYFVLPSFDHRHWFIFKNFS